MKCTHSNKRILLIISLGVILLLLVLLSLPLLTIGLEGMFVKLDIHNPYINRHYKNWEYVSIQGFNGFYIPEGWSVSEDTGLYTIYDAAGRPWAYGAAFGTENDRFSDYNEIIAKAYSLDTIEITIDPFVQFSMMNGSDIDLVIIQEETAVKNIYCIQMLETAQIMLAWFLTADISANQEQFDIAEAIVYSYAFEVVRHGRQEWETRDGSVS